METACKTMNLTFAVEDTNGNSITCPNEPFLDSVRSSSSCSSDSPADVEMEDYITFPNTHESSSQRLKSTRKDVVDFVASKIGNWNENMTFLVVAQSDDKEETSESSPEYETQELPDMDSASPCGSMDKCCSVSSSEMMMRSNSFVSHEPDQPVSISVLGESKTSSTNSSEFIVVSSTLPDVCEGLFKELPAEDSQGETRNHVSAASNQTFVINGEGFRCPDSEGKALLATNPKFECITPVYSRLHGKDLQNCAASSPLQPITATFSEDFDISNAQASTPVQSVTNRTFCLPTLSESPLFKDSYDSVSPMAEVIRQQQECATQKPISPLVTSSKTPKVETKKFPRPNFSNLKSKIISRATSAFKISNTPSISKKSSEKQTVDGSTLFKTPLNNSTQALSKKRLMSDKRPAVAHKERYSAAKPQHCRLSEDATTFKRVTDEAQAKNQRIKVTLSLLTKDSETSHDSQLQNLCGKIKSANKTSSEVCQENKPTKVLGKTPRNKVISGKEAAAAPCDGSKGRLSTQSSRTRAGCLPPPLPTSKLKPGVACKDASNANSANCTSTISPRTRLSTPDGNARLRIHSIDAVSSGTPSRPRTLVPSTSRLPVKPKTLSKQSTSHPSGPLNQADLAEPSGRRLIEPHSSRTTIIRSKLQVTSNKTASSVVTRFKKTSPGPGSSVRSSSSPLKIPTPARLVRSAASTTVDKNKFRTSSRNLQPPTNLHPDLVPPEVKPRNVDYKTLCEKKNQTIQQLQNVIRFNNCRFEAVAVVIKHLCSEHEAVKTQRKELSQELNCLRGELVNSTQSCERLEQEKEELRSAFDGVLQKVQAQHCLDLTDLEEKLKTFYSTEWEKVHQTYQEESDRCKVLLEKQLEELRSNHEALKTKLDVSHVEEVTELKTQFEEAFKELRHSHEKEAELLNTSLKESEETLSNRIQDLIMENNDLKEKLSEEEKRRRDLSEKSQDSHTLYLVQELESLKVVLDIKNKRIHEQDKRLVQMDKLMEKNVKLDEDLKKLQQENEDIKARMDKHAALSRQLSTEQAALQESLHKESKVNKRLSMENEELMWKLHNGDLSSPLKVSPSSSLTLHETLG